MAYSSKILFLRLYDEFLLDSYQQIEMRYIYWHPLDTRGSTIEQNLINNRTKKLENPDLATMGMCVRACKCNS